MSSGIFSKMIVTLSGMEFWPFPRCVEREPFLNAGFSFYEFGDTIEKWYIYAKAPKDWSYSPLNQFITKIIDEKGRNRGIIMILVDDTGIIYDANAWLSQRFILGYMMENNYLIITLTDIISGDVKKIHKTESTLETDIVEIANLEMMSCSDRLSELYPGWKNPSCWDEGYKKLETDIFGRTAPIKT